ncbi:hypothetical protein F5Y13DRAFT_202090 [Hypoxylon sp. FL1857]|nr:hypothetical protein F5Y13DRAFT_202090 [Hypoxylon sp. FL1857]
MEGIPNNSRRHHRRSNSSAPSLVASEGKHGRATDTQMTRGANDLETITYLEARQRKEVLALKDEWSTWSDNIGKRALHYKPIRDDSKLCGFLDAAQGYDQELLYLDFHLRGPNRIYFLPAEDTERAIASLRRASSTLLSAGWQIRRCIDLLDIHNSVKAAGRSVWSEVLKRTVDAGKLDAEIQYQDFRQATRPRFKLLLEELGKETPRMRWIVHHLDRNRALLFIQRLKENASHTNVSTSSTQQEGLSLDTGSGGHPKEMSGCLWGDTVQKSPTCVDSLGLKFDELGIDSATAASQVRYQALKACEKLRCPGRPETSRAAWAAFCRGLDNQARPPSSAMILLRHKAFTRILLAERQLLEQSEAQSGSGGRSRDVGTQLRWVMGA